MHINDIMDSQILDAVNLPSRQHYAIFDEELRQEAMMDDEGGRMYYGESDWELIVDGHHPHVQCQKLQITLH